MNWKKTARGLWEAREGVVRAKVEHDNGVYVWQVSGAGESVVRGAQRLKKDAIGRAEAAAGASSARVESAVPA